MDMNTLPHEIDSWPVDDRIHFVQEVWDRLVDQGLEPDLTETQAAELDRRLAAHKASPGKIVPWEEVERHARSRIA